MCMKKIEAAEETTEICMFYMTGFVSFLFMSSIKL